MTEQAPLILCVEDNDDLRTDIAEELVDNGYRVLECAGGRDALEQLDVVTPDLILCDVLMPGANGYDVLRQVRETRPDLAGVPFVLLTALAEPAEVIDGKRRGADDYLVKPIDFDLLLATIEARLREVRRIHVQRNRDLERMRENLESVVSLAGETAFRQAATAFDHLAHGVILVDADYRVLHANNATKAIALDARHTLIETRANDGSQHLTAPLVRELGSLRDADGADQGCPCCFRLEHPQAARELLVVAFPCAGASEATATPPDAAPPRPAKAFVPAGEGNLIVFVIDPGARPSAPPEALEKLFDFTPTEARIALSLAEGRRSDEIATTHGVSSTTVAFHIRNMFQKTGTHRQADLIALILGGPLTLALG